VKLPHLDDESSRKNELDESPESYLTWFHDFVDSFENVAVEVMRSGPIDTSEDRNREHRHVNQ
jgi:hypothetical protein